MQPDGYSGLWKKTKRLLRESGLYPRRLRRQSIRDGQALRAGHQKGGKPYDE
ncbi:MAG: hypothetical protein LKM30_02255 [Bacilli bacterium]|nr:hypothetical protein [Bacilli bacterium]